MCQKFYARTYFQFILLSISKLLAHFVGLGCRCLYMLSPVDIFGKTQFFASKRIFSHL